MTIRSDIVASLRALADTLELQPDFGNDFRVAPRGYVLVGLGSMGGTEMLWSGPDIDAWGAVGILTTAIARQTQLMDNGGSMGPYAP